MKSIKSLLKSIVMVVSMSLLVSACSNSNENAGQQDNSNEVSQSTENTANTGENSSDTEKVKLRVAYMPNMGSASALIAAKDNGIFDKYNLDVELTRFSNGPDEIAAMGSEDIDISQIGHGAHKLAIQGQAVVFELDSTSLADEVIGNAERGVNSLADLKGKRIASTKGTSSDIILKLALEDAGLTEDDVEILEMDASGVVPSMVSGQIDAVATWSPSTVTIKEQLGDNAVVLADNSTYIDKASFPSSFITTDKFAKDNRDVLVRFAAAIQEAQDIRIEKLDEVAKSVAKETEIDEETILKSKNEGDWETSGTEFIKKGLADGTIKNFYETQQKTFLDSGEIEEEVPVENYVLFDIMQEANDLVNK